MIMDIDRLDKEYCYDDMDNRSERFGVDFLIDIEERQVYNLFNYIDSYNRMVIEND